MARRKLHQGLCIVTFILSLTFMAHLTNNSWFTPGWKSSETLKREIQSLSVEYVRQLIEESDGRGISGAQPVKIDMSKSLAVVLRSLLDKTERLEKQLEAVHNYIKVNCSSTANDTVSQRPKYT